MVTLKMEKRNFLSRNAMQFRITCTREELKKRYSYACRNGRYALAQVYLCALYGRKECYYDYQHNRFGSYAFEYPPIRV